jgi:hypothetical protein
MRVTPHNIDRNGKVKIKKREFKTRKPKNLQTKPMHLWAVDTIQRVSNGVRKYIMTLIDPNSRIAFAVAIPTKHTKYTAKVLEALIDGLNIPHHSLQMKTPVQYLLNTNPQCHMYWTSTWCIYFIEIWL